MIKQAVILAGGMGTRLEDMTKTMPKGFIQIQGEAMVETSCKKLFSCGVQQIIIGTGHCKEFYESLANKYTGLIKTVYNKDYQNTSSMGTLAVCAQFVEGDFLLLESDLLYDDIGLFALKNSKYSNVLLASGDTYSGDEVYVAANKEGILEAISKKKQEVANVTGELVGISRVSKDFLDKMVAFYKADIKNNIKMDYEKVFLAVNNLAFNEQNKKQKALDKDAFMHICTIQNYIWSEVDTKKMLQKALDVIYPKIKESQDTRAVKRQVLLNPGPSTTSDSVKYAQVQADICPREKEFGQIMKEIADDLTAFVADKNTYTTVMFGGSGTAADEAMIASCIPPNGKLLVVDNGSYGKRLSTIAKVYNIDMEVFVSSTFQPLDIEALCQKIKTGDFSALAIVYHETTTGLLNPLDKICPVAKKAGLITLVDAVSAYAGLPMDLEKLGIDFASATSNKHIGGMAGVGFVVCRKSELLKQEQYPMRCYYLNLFDQYKYFIENAQTRFTPPVQTLYALRQAIIETKIETIQKRYERFTQCWHILVKALDDIGLQMLVAKQNQSHFITAIKIPEAKGYNFKTFHDIALKAGFTIYPGKLGNIDTFRIANMGDIRPCEMSAFVPVMKDYMKSIGVGH